MEFDESLKSTTSPLIYKNIAHFYCLGSKPNYYIYGSNIFSSFMFDVSCNKPSLNLAINCTKKIIATKNPTLGISH